MKARREAILNSVLSIWIAWIAMPLGHGLVLSSAQAATAPLGRGQDSSLLPKTQKDEEEEDSDEGEDDVDSNDSDDSNHDEAADPVTGNITLASNYFLRGLTQTENKPAVQGGFDYAHPIGFSFGVWGSNVRFEDSDASIELDVSGAYTYSFTDSLSATLGVNHATYFGDSERDSWDFPLRIQWNAWTAEVDYSPRWVGNEHAWYLSAGWSDEVLWKFRLGAFAGYSIFSGAQNITGTTSAIQARAGESDSLEESDETESEDPAPASPVAEPPQQIHSPNYADFRLSLSREFLSLDWTLSWIIINHAEEVNGASGSSRVVFSISKSL